MNILLLGNGFDLYHKLPTTYASFLQSTNYLVNNICDFPLTIGKVFNNIENPCKAIRESVSAYGAQYNCIQLKQEDIIVLKDLCRNNMWWKYFSFRFDEDMGWIDFEKEIAAVLNRYNCFFDRNSRSNNFDIRKEQNIPMVDMFYVKSPSDTEIYIIKDEYKAKENDSWNNDLINKREIVKTLWESLLDLAEALSCYLRCFVVNPLDILVGENAIKTNKELFFDLTHNINDRVISFNYTPTYEKLYNNKDCLVIVNHIHGTIDNSIVVGVNSDINDEKEGDQLFIKFKKYFQREKSGTTDSYVEFIGQIMQFYKDTLLTSVCHEDINLIVFGHSLDATDKDIIEPLLNSAHNIMVYYHDKHAKEDYIKNLIQIYGKTEYDKLRIERNLTFLPIDNTKKVMNNDQL